MKPDDKGWLPNFKKLVWIFVITCFIGYIVEIIFCIVWYGKLENRQGVLYGPFTQVYGIGAIIMCFTVIPISKYGFIPTFLVSALVGGTVEFASSYCEELIFGTRSWNFSNHLLTLDGRTSLPMMLAWGALGYTFAKWIYPCLNKWIDKIKITKSNAMCAITAIFFVANFTLSGLAVDRWMERIHGQQADTRIDSFLDRIYPDSRMAFIFPKIEPVD